MFGQSTEETVDDSASVGINGVGQAVSDSAPTVDPAMSSNYMMAAPSSPTLPVAEPPQAASSAVPTAPATPTSTDDLLILKQQALEQLGPMVDQLDQPPDEKFKTIMMMIQASDDQTKLGDALELAKAITDDKARAQALLDVINEINYFTQPKA